MNSFAAESKSPTFSFMHPRRVHKAVAIGEMFTWSFLIIGMILKYSSTTAAVVPIAGGIHGFGFLCFVIFTLAIWVNNSWPASWGVLGVAVSAIPFAALPFMLLAEKKGLLDQDWRFRDGEQPRTVAEKVLALVVRNPVRAVVVGVVLVAFVFTVLLHLGPPVDVEKALSSSS
ncbi:hypothetical protein CFELI_07720 [Corynebacterium felinum]|uniref:Integral membrane protein n=2 Tax=Corynebacterium felinum TaxID=131318 RepID=A0ABU2BDK5_9CORY|nr:integral membrane protein [Corynebacterium felinum]WJY95158.1 hypothetical protein CFELI_07720 [Corynebacterium felinum]